MPSVSAAQHRAMEAAAHGHSTLGIPKKVGAEFVAKDATGGHAAGILFVAPDGDVLLLRRASTEENFAGHWALPGGKAEDGETPEVAADREAKEEAGAVPVGRKRVIDRRVTPNKMAFHTFAQAVDAKFTPTLNSEHSGFAWAPLHQLPGPLHPAVRATLDDRLGTADDMAPEDWAAMRDGFVKWTREEESEPEHATAQDCVAFDATGTARTYDRDGRLHVSGSNISKSNVCGYLGREIPGHLEMGLDPARRYRLLRHPEELARAAHTFNNVPVLNRHVAVTADSHQPDQVIGSTGTDASFEEPYLRNSLVFWARDAIDDIEDLVRKELSSSYHYRADMTPGTYRGERYDGVMRDIVGNHVALVPEGRAGDDVVVGDSRLTGQWVGDADQPRDADGKFGSGGGHGVHAVTPTPNGARYTMKRGNATHHLEVTRKGAFVAHHQDGMQGSFEPKISKSVFPGVHESVRDHMAEHGPHPEAGAGVAPPKKGSSAGNQIKRNAAAAKKVKGAFDSKELDMTKVLTRKAALAQGAITAFLLPLLAQDAKVDLNPALVGVTAKNFKARKPAIIAGVKKATFEKLAQDASIDALGELLDKLGEEKVQEGADTDPSTGLPMAAMPEAPPEGDDMDDMEMDADPMMKIKAFLAGKLSPEDMAQIEAMCGGAQDDADGEAMVPPATVGDRMGKDKMGKDKMGKDKMGRDAPPDFSGMPKVGGKPMATQEAVDKAMDAAIRGERERQIAIRDAERAVRPYVGDLAMAHDSAEGVYRTALTTLGVDDAKDMNLPALRAVLKQQRLAGAPRVAAVAMDAATTSDFNKRFPGAARIGRA